MKRRDLLQLRRCPPPRRRRSANGRLHLDNTQLSEAGKKGLKNRWNIRTFPDVDWAIGDVIRHALNDVRYVAERQGDSNVTRERLDPLWAAMTEQVDRGLFESRAGLLPSQFKGVERQLAIDTCTALMLGNLAGLAVAQGMDDERIKTTLRDRFRQLVASAINDPVKRFWRSVDRARDKLHFIGGK